jgi:glutathione S-transferase
MSFPARIAAHLNNHKVSVQVGGDAKKNVTGAWPMLETEQGTISDAVAIAKFLAHGHANLLGTSVEARASIDQWIYWFITGAANDQRVAVAAILGQKPCD